MLWQLTSVHRSSKIYQIIKNEEGIYQVGEDFSEVGGKI